MTGTNYNRSANKATDGAIPDSRRPDSIVTSEAADGTQVIRMGEAVSTASGQTVTNQTEKLADIAKNAKAGVRVEFRAVNFVRGSGKLLGVVGVGVILHELIHNPDYHAADAVQDLFPVPMSSAY